MMDGIINIKKEKGFTSFDVVAKLRGILKQKKIGHTGTLDPDATGVLPVCLGNATKLCDMLTDKTKEYIAEFLLGQTTDTQDISGTVLKEEKVLCTEEDVRKVISSFKGEIEQIPPMYSAIKINGKKLYELAREGKAVERKARHISVYEIEILSINLPVVKIRVECSKGTYIRTICHDVGEKLGCGAVMCSLVRTRSGAFLLENALTLDEVEAYRDQQKLDTYIQTTDQILSEYPSCVVRGEVYKKICNGNAVTLDELEMEHCMQGQRFRIYGMEQEKKQFLALYEYHSERETARPFKMFLPQEG